MAFEFITPQNLIFLIKLRPLKAASPSLRSYLPRPFRQQHCSFAGLSLHPVSPETEMRAISVKFAAVRDDA